MKQVKLLLLSAMLIFQSTWVGAQGELVSSEFRFNNPALTYFLIIGTIAEYGVTGYKINYTTTNLEGEIDTVSGLITFPATDTISSPTILAQHGTVASRAEVPSNLSGGYELGAIFSALGYITVQPDYLGLGDSKGFHPYVHADSEASAGVDMLLAAKAFFAENEINYNEQLFVTGYSQGGHAAMAAHRLLEMNYSESLPVTAAAHLSGPYSISTATKERLLSDEPYLFPGYAAWTLMSYNEAYGLYDNINEYLKAPYDSYATQFYNEEIDLSGLHALMITKLEEEQGASIIKHMFQDSILTAVIENENHPFNIALRDNDTYDWAPQAPTRLYYCMADDQVAFTNSVIADSVMNANGAPDVSSRDVASSADHGGCVLPAGLATIAFFGELANFDLTTSTKDLPKLEGIQAFPNPVSQRLQLNGVPAQATLNIFNLNGQLLDARVLKEGSNGIGVQNYKSGVYLFRVIAEEGVWNEQVIIKN